MQNKICSICNIEKDINEYYFSDIRQKHLSWCKKCHKERSKKRQRDIELGIGKPVRRLKKIHPDHDLTNKRKGKLICIEPIGFQKNHRIWRCKCDCGNFCDILGTSLLSNRRISCGCANGRGNKSFNWRGAGEISLRYWNTANATC